MQRSAKQKWKSANVYLISLPSCLTAPLVASSCQCCPSSHPSHHLLAPGLCQLGQTRQGTPQSQSSERIIKTKGYTVPIHSYVCTYVSNVSLQVSDVRGHSNALRTHTPMLTEYQLTWLLLDRHDWPTECLMHRWNVLGMMTALDDYLQRFCSNREEWFVAWCISVHVPSHLHCLSLI